MLMPTMRTNVFDDLFNNPFFTKSESSMMKTDIKEHDNCYDLMIDLPGVKKEDIKAELNDGYLTVSAENNTSKDEKDDNGKYICKTELLNLTDVANTEKKVPLEWINKEHNGVEQPFIDYVLPLIQGEPNLPKVDSLPRFAKLKKVLAK